MVVRAQKLLQYLQLHDKNYVYKGMVVSARRLLQYLQLQDKNSRYISRYICKFFRNYKIVMYVFHYSSCNP
jgi:hypothetical protein